MKKNVFFSLLLVMLPCTLLAVLPKNNKASQRYSLFSSKGREFTAESVYLKPENILDDNSHNSINEDIPLKTLFDWGFDLKSVHYLSDNRFTSLIWTYYKNEKGETALVPQVVTQAGGHQVSSGDPFVPYSYISNLQKLAYDYGQLVSSIDKLYFRVYGGIEYAKIHTGYQFRLDVTDRATRRLINDAVDYNYQLLGPRIGVHLDYKVFKSWLISSHGTLAILEQMGRHKSSENEVISNAGVVQKRRNITVNDKLQGAILGIDFYFGLKYHMNTFPEQLSLVAGYNAYVFMEPNATWGGVSFGLRWQGL